MYYQNSQADLGPTGMVGLVSKVKVIDAPVFHQYISYRYSLNGDWN